MLRMVFDKSFAEFFAQQWIDAMNRRDLSAIFSRCHADSTGTDTGVELTDKATIQKQWQEILECSSRLEFQLIDVLSSVNTMCIYYKVDIESRAIEWLRFNERGELVEACSFGNNLPSSNAAAVSNGYVDKAFAESFAEEWAASWNTHDLPRVLSHYTEDFQMTSPFIARIAGNPEGALHGKPAVGEYWAKALSKFADLHFAVHDVLYCADSVCIYYDSVLGLRAVEWLKFNSDRMVVAASGSYNDFPC